MRCGWWSSVIVKEAESVSLGYEKEMDYSKKLDLRIRGLMQYSHRTNV